MKMREAVAVILVVPLMVVLAACGGDGASTSTDSTGVSSDTSTAASSTTSSTAAGTTSTPALGNSDVVPEKADPPTAAERYPASVREEWLSDCKGFSGGNTALCRCSLLATESTMPVDQFQELYKANTIAPSEMPRATVAGMSYCSQAHP